MDGTSSNRRPGPNPPSSAGTKRNLPDEQGEQNGAGYRLKIPRHSAPDRPRPNTQQLGRRSAHHSNTSAPIFTPRMEVQKVNCALESVATGVDPASPQALSTISIHEYDAAPIQQLVRVNQGRQRAAVFYGDGLSGIAERLQNLSGVDWVELPCSPAGRIIICWQRGSALGKRAAEDMQLKLELIDKWQAKARKNKIDDQLRRTIRDTLLLEAQIDLIDGDDSWQKRAQKQRIRCAELCIPGIVGSTPLVAAEQYQRTHYRFTNFIKPKHLHRKLYAHLNDQGFWKGSTKADRDAFLKKCGELACFGGNSEAGAVQKRASKIQELQKALISGDISNNFTRAKKMIHELDELEKELYEACEVAVGTRPAKGLFSSLAGLFSFSSEIVPGDVYKNQPLFNLSLFEKNETQKTRASTLNNLLQWVQMEKQLIIQVASDPGAMLCEGKLTWNEAIEFKRCGYNLDPSFTVCSELKDHHLRDPEGRVLGEGAFHEAVELEYSKKDPPCTRVFKGISSRDRSGWREIVGAEYFMDEKSPRHTARNIAVRDIASELGIGALVPDCQFGVHNLQLGIQMTKAEGMLGAARGVRDRGGLSDNFQEIDRHKTFCFETIKHLNQLEWLDALCANLDRNDGNIIFKSSGKVTGIDHDVCLYPFPYIIQKPRLQKFEEQLQDADAQLQHATTPSQRKDIQQQITVTQQKIDKTHRLYRAGCRVGYPLLVDSAMLDKFEKIDIKSLRYRLRHKLTVRELDALEKRFDLLLTHARGLRAQGYAVPKWEDWRNTENQNVYQFLVANQVNGGDVGEEMLCRERLADPHAREARRILEQAGGAIERMTDDQRLTYQVHLNLETTKRLGINTSYTALYFGQSRTG